MIAERDSAGRLDSTGRDSAGRKESTLLAGVAGGPELFSGGDTRGSPEGVGVAAVGAGTLLISHLSLH